jgi:hypothetical protein
MQRIEFKPTWGNTIAMIVGGVVFLGLWLFLVFGMSPPTRNVAKYWAAVVAGPVLWGGCLVAGVWSALWRPAIVTLDQRGIRYKRFRGARFMPWGLVDRVVLHQLKKAQRMEVFARALPDDQMEAVRAQVSSHLLADEELVKPGERWFLGNKVQTLHLDQVAAAFDERLPAEQRVERPEYKSAKELPGS